MPAKSKAQFGCMGLVASGKKKLKGKTKVESMELAKEYIKGQYNYKSLPIRKKK